ncbi:MAG: hypothetical protein ACNI27_14270 [Desulfovibrio sp.]
MQLPNSLNVDYILNAKGQRIGKAINGQIIEEYLWNGLTELRAVRTKHGMVEYRHSTKSHDNSIPPVQVYHGNTAYLLHVDQVGTPFALTDKTGMWSFAEMFAGDEKVFENGNDLKRYIKNANFNTTPTPKADNILDRNINKLQKGRFGKSAEAHAYNRTYLPTDEDKQPDAWLNRDRDLKGISEGKTKVAKVYMRSGKPGHSAIDIGDGEITGKYPVNKKKNTTGYKLLLDDCVEHTSDLLKAGDIKTPSDIFYALPEAFFKKL